MAKKSKQDVVKAKAAKQKKIAIVGAVLFVVIAAIQVPKTMKMLNKKPAPPITSTVTTTTGVTTPSASAAPSDPNSLAAPTLGGSPTTVLPSASPSTSSSDLVSAVPVSAGTGQLQTFERFATKDPFAVQAGASGTSSSTSSGSAGGGGTTSTTSTPTPPTPAPPTPPTTAPPTVPAAQQSAIISVNGELASVSVGTDFPTAGTVFSRVGAIFHLVSAGPKGAKVAIAGGAYADGSKAISLTLGKPLTLQNTADGTKYTLILEPANTPLTTPGTVSTTPGSTLMPVAPASGSGG